MRNKSKVLFVCLLMAAVFILEPVSYVLADDTSAETTEEGYDRTISIPKVNSSKVEFEKKDFFDLYGLLDVPEENSIQKLIVSHLDIESIDYSLYDLICDFEFKTLGDDGTITTSTYSHNIDLKYYILGNIVDDITTLEFLNTVNNFYNLGTKFFIHEFNYGKVVENAEGFRKRPVTGKMIYYTYNTVISQLDLYFVRKSDGERGMSRRYTFTWDSDFWLQKCTKITFSWYDHSADVEKEISSVEDSNGVNGYSTDTKDEYAWKDIIGFFTDIPAALVALVVGFIEIVVYITGLFQAVFPFIPPVVFVFLGCFILITILIAVYKIVISVL